MAEGFEPYHVPQQSRRDKLRVNNQPPGCVDNIQGCAPLVPLYDPSLISSDLISCDANVHRQSFGVKEEGMNLMGFSGHGQGINASNHMYLDPQLSVHLNPSTIQDISNSGGNPYAYFRGVLDHHQSIQEPINSSCNNSGQSLSLSLSSHPSAHNLPLELNLHRYESNSMFDNNSSSNNNGDKVSGGGFFVACNNGGSTTIELSKSAVPLGPFTGYASVLRGSRFLKPAQQLLEELCDVGRGIYAEKNGGPDSSLLDPPPLENLDDSLNSSDGAEQTRKKSRLLSMLDEVYKRYKQYYQQMQAAVAAFESVAGLSNAAPFANLALKAMSKHFRCLKNAITAQLQFTSKSHGKIHSDRSEDTQRMDTSGRGTFGQRPFQGAGFVDQPVWRPQRGLPERAVTVLRAWLFEHFLHPYPTDTDKILLAKQTGLSRNQVSNWFINARVRLWKPMVEEIHMLETRQAQKPSSQRDEEQPLPPPPTTQTSQIESENASTSFHRIGDTFPNLKRTRDDPNGPPMKTPYDSLLHNNNPHSGIGVSNGGVSLTLGLHQNGGVGLSDSYPMNAARRFGLDSSHGGEGFVVSGFSAQNRQFGRDHHHHQIIEGQLMHDFVG